MTQILILTVLLLATVILTALLCCFKRSKNRCRKCKSCVNKIKEKVLYNPLLRYLLLNAIKFNMIVMMSLKKPSNERSASRAKSVLLMLTFCLAVPAFIASLLHRNRDKLDRETLKNKIGTLYMDRNVTKSEAYKPKAWLVPLSFFVRRTCFIYLTVFVFDNPYF